MAKTITGKQVGDSYYQVEHPSGLTVLLYPKEHCSTTYAIFGTRYGSIDNCFQRSDEAGPESVPEGIAHYLEHKLFESEEGDAFERFSKTGASANAFTSFESTCYLFSTTDQVYQSLEILLDFVQSPYFTEETVRKEQGIIGQEIKMYDDDPQWRVMFNYLKAMYRSHPIREDIAGTVESIAKITPELLYRCYNTFYNLGNMVLAIAGNFQVDKALAVCDKMLKPAAPVTVQRVFPQEPDTIVQPVVEERLSVASPLFQFGFKGGPAPQREGRGSHGSAAGNLGFRRLAFVPAAAGPGPGQRVQLLLRVLRGQRLRHGDVLRRVQRPPGGGPGHFGGSGALPAGGHPGRGL